MVLSIKRQNVCKCGSLKDQRATQCTGCRRKAWIDKKLIGRRIKCNCGQLMDHRSSKCVDCFKQTEANRRKLRKICDCGGAKGEKSTQCLNCRLKKINPIVDGKVFCTACRSWKLLDQFHRRKNGKPRRWCLECTAAFTRYRHIFQKCRKLGIEDDKILEIINLEAIECEICNNKVKRFHIDHCHKTNKFRGLLCGNCNSGLGLYKDDPTRLRAAANYLDRFALR